MHDIARMSRLDWAIEYVMNSCEKIQGMEFFDTPLGEALAALYERCIVSGMYGPVQYKKGVGEEKADFLAHVLMSQLDSSDPVLAEGSSTIIRKVLGETSECVKEEVTPWLVLHDL